ncbi:MAG: hypothetical protein ACJ8LM_17265 [Candidatus Udaeobacter sp.]
MDNSTAKTSIDLATLVNVDHIQVLDIAYKKRTAWALKLDTPLGQRHNLLLKRSVDLFFSSLLLLFIFSWLFPIIALLIMLDSKEKTESAAPASGPITDEDIPF